MKFSKVNFFSATLTVPDWFAPLFPLDLPVDKWPSYCGAGSGFGDAIVPEYIRGVCLSPACLIHDIEWSTCDRTFKAFIASNLRFYGNCLALVRASGKPRLKQALSALRCTLYFASVSTVGVYFFLAGEDYGELSKDPIENPIVIEKLRRLSRAKLGI